MRKHPSPKIVLKKKQLLFFCWHLVIVLALSLSSDPIASAQRPEAEWSAPTRLNDLPGLAGGGAVVGAPNGDLYAIWVGNSSMLQNGFLTDSNAIGDVSGQSENANPDVVYFRQFQNGIWTPSVDIIAPPGSAVRFEVDAFKLDPYGRLVLLWHNNRELFLSIADAKQARNASAWKTRNLNKGELVWGASLAITADGVFHVVMCGERQEVVYFQSTDAGENWRAVSSPSHAENNATQVHYPDMVVGKDGVIHITWTESTQSNGWNPAGTYYARSMDGGKTWSDVIRLTGAPGHGQSSVTTDDRGTVLVFWNRRVGSEDGRYFARSTTNGRTWESPKLAFEGVSGFSGPATFLWDSAGILHLINAGYGKSVAGQIWQSEWQGTGWSAPVALKVQGKLADSEVFSASITNGNKIWLVWAKLDSKDLFLTSKMLPAPVAVSGRLALPTPAPTFTSTPRPIKTPTNSPTRANSIPLNDDMAAIGSQSNLLPLAAGSLPVLLLVFVAVLKSRHH